MIGNIVMNNLSIYLNAFYLRTKSKEIELSLSVFFFVPRRKCDAYARDTSLSNVAQRLQRRRRRSAKNSYINDQSRNTSRNCGFSFFSPSRLLPFRVRKEDEIYYIFRERSFRVSRTPIAAQREKRHATVASRSNSDRVAAEISLHRGTLIDSIAIHLPEKTHRQVERRLIVFFFFFFIKLTNWKNY